MKVIQAGGGNCTTISACLPASGSTLSGNYCIDIQDNATYPEQVTVQNVKTSGFQIFIGTTTGATRPVISPPANSTAAFALRNTSVTISNVSIIGTNPIPYGVLASSAYVTLSTINVSDASNNIAFAGVWVSSYSSISYSTVSVQAANALGFYLNGSLATSISNSYASAAANYGLYFDGASFNTITGVFISSGGAKITNHSAFNTISLSTSISASASQTALNLGGTSSSNTFTQSYFQNLSGNVVDLGSGVNNVVNLSSAIGLVSFTMGGGYDTVTQCYIEGRNNNGNYALHINSSNNSVSSSTVKNFAALSSAVQFDSSASSNVLTYDTIHAGSGNAIFFYFPGGSNNNYNTISFSTLSATAAIPVDIFNGGSYNLITNNYITSASGIAAVRFNTGNNNTVANSYLQGDPAVRVNTNNNIVSSNNLTVFSNGNNALETNGGITNLTVSGNVITGGATASGISIAANDSGTINLSTNTISSSQYGINISNLNSGAQVWITSNTIIPTISNAHTTYGIYLNGLTTGATIQNNAIVYRNSGSAAGQTTYGLYAQGASGLNINHNQFNDPSMVTGGSFIAAYFTGTTNTLFKFNDINATDSANLTQNYLLQLAAGSAGAQVKDNIFSSSLTVTGGGSSSATIVVDAASQSGFQSDYNDFYSYNSTNTAIWGTTGLSLLSGWQGAPANQDAHSISSNPLWFNTAAGSEDFHPQSQTGRYSPASQSFTQDCFTSPTIDKGDPAESFALEPGPNGGAVNQGSYGDTTQASETFQIQPPASIGATALIGQVTISWTPPSIPQSCVSYVDHFELSYSSVSSAGPFSTPGGGNPISSNTFVFLHTGLQSKTTYFYQVLTADAFGNKSTPAQTFAVTPDSIAPAGITNFAASQGQAIGQVSLNWTFPGDDNGTTTLPAGSQYAIQYTTDNVSVIWSTANAQVTLSTANVPVGALQNTVISSLNQSALYYFRIWSNHPGPVWSTPSNIASSFSKQAGPSVLSMSPADGSGCVLQTANISINFSQTMQYAAFAGAFTVTITKDNLGNSVNTVIPGTLSPASSTNAYTFTPSTALAPSSTFAISISTQAVDLLGNSLTQATSAQFATVMDHTQPNLFSLSSLGINVTVPGGALSADGCIQASTAALSSNIAAATQKLLHNTGDAYRNPIPGSIVDLKAYDSLGNIQTGGFNIPLTISIPYPDSQNKGVVDGTNPPVLASTLSIWWLDDVNAVWIQLPNSSVDSANKRVTATTPHFTTFAIIGQSASDVGNAYAFPVPFKPSAGHQNITFINTGQQSAIKIYTLTGELVRELTSGTDGKAVWDVTNASGGKVVSGGYFYIITNSGNKKTGKLMIIR